MKFRAQTIFTKIKKKLYQINTFQFRKKNKNILVILCLHIYIAHVKFKKASFNSNQDTRQNIAGDAGDGDGAQTIPPAIFLKWAGGKNKAD